jgi:type I restriction enzyme M protein
MTHNPGTNVHMGTLSLFDQSPEEPTETMSTQDQAPTESTTSTEATHTTEATHITQQQLNSDLWKSADILRGSVDSSDYRNFVFVLLFYKRINDVFRETQEQLLKKFAKKPESLKKDLIADRNLYPIFVPKEATWEELTKVSQNIGQAINDALDAIATANTTKLPQLGTIVKLSDFNKSMSDQDGEVHKVISDQTLQTLLTHFSDIDLRNSRINTDLLGGAYEYLMEKFADAAGKKGGEFYTPKMVVKLLVQLLDPKEGESVYDPTCGSGGMLIEAVRHLQEEGKNTEDIHLFGQEKNLNTWAIAQINCILQGKSDARIARGDTILDPYVFDEKKKKARNDEEDIAPLKDGVSTFDIVIANPPFSLKNWFGNVLQSKKDQLAEAGKKTKSVKLEAADFPLSKRFKYGMPPNGYGDLAFLGHMIASLKEHGRAGVVLPHGILFRGGAEGHIRRRLIDATAEYHATKGKKKASLAYLQELPTDLIEAVIGLPPNLFYGTGIPACILLLNMNKPEERQGKILFINASEEYGEGTNQNLLRKEDIEKIVDAYKSFEDQELYSRVVSLEEIAENEFNLNITRYVQTEPPEEKIDVAVELQLLIEMMESREQAEKKMFEFIGELGYES